MSFRKFQEMLGVTGYMEPADDEGAKGGMTGGDDDKGGKAGGDDDKGSSDEGDGDDDSDDDKDEKSGDDDKNKSKTSEREATLLKESMKRKEQLKTLESELDETKKQLQKFDGIDLDQVNKLLEEAKTAETKKLEEKGEWEKLKAQMVEQHNAELDKYKNLAKEAQGAVDSANATIDKLTIGHEFDSSAFISDEMTLTPTKARIIYGDHFDVVDGKTVAFDKPRGADGRTQLVNGEGNPLGFNDALKKIVDGDPDRDFVIKSKMKPGSDSKESSGKKKPTVKSLHGRDRIAAGLSSLTK